MNARSEPQVVVVAAASAGVGQAVALFGDRAHERSSPFRANTHRPLLAGALTGLVAGAAGLIGRAR